MKANQHQKFKPQPPRPLFSCGFFRHCTQSVLSPTAPNPPPLPEFSNSTSSPPRLTLPPPSSTTPPTRPPPPQKPHKKPESSSSSSSSTSTSQSFTQWRFPLPTSPPHQHHSGAYPPSETDPRTVSTDPLPPINLQELFHVAELQLTSGSDSEQLAALQLLERSVVPNPPSDPPCPPDLMRELVGCLKSNRAAAKPVTKILLALSLAEGNRRVAVEAGAAGAVVETVGELEGATAERALAALELMCTVPEGAAEVRTHALAVPVLVAVMARLAGRGREYAISVLAVVYGGGGGVGDGSGEGMPAAPAEEVSRAVVLALQGGCTARGRRKGTHLLKTLEEYGRLDLTHDGT